MVEGLRRKIQATHTNNELVGLKLHANPSASTHQQFVDDTLRMGIPTTAEARTFNHILNLFSESSGTTINMQKKKLQQPSTYPMKYY